MGSGSEGEKGGRLITGQVGEQAELFELGEMGSRKPEVGFPLEGVMLDGKFLRKAPTQTAAKSRLIAEYIRLFQTVTRGGVYIDGFAGPQKRDFEDAWTAKRVLELEPKRLRKAWLCEIDPGGLQSLRRLKSSLARTDGPNRISVIAGDFNENVVEILRSPRIRRRTAVFALLDQRTAECHWRTVERLAARAGNTKIELMYFLATGWLGRSLSQSRRPERLAELDAWWGGPEWRELIGAKHRDLVRRFSDRFVNELGYKFVRPYGVYQTEGTRRALMFHLIHASDHPEAPEFMLRAYKKVVGELRGMPPGQLSFLPND